MSVHIDTPALFNRPFTDNKEYNHCRGQEQEQKEERKKHALRKACLNIRCFTVA